jgi:hypothetical protein
MTANRFRLFLAIWLSVAAAFSMLWLGTFQNVTFKLKKVSRVTGYQRNCFGYLRSIQPPVKK